jgi:thiamine pyrophosphokinase
LKRCIIITSNQSSKIRDQISIKEDDFVICADGGYRFATEEGIRPDVIIGDFDSFHGEIDEGVKTIKANVDKDDTDTMLCLKHGIEKGCDSFIIVGGLGGRLDHTLANLQCMAYAIDQEKSIWIVDGKNRATMLGYGTIKLVKRPGTMLSIFSYTDQCRGVNVRGVKWPLIDATLDNSSPLGVSNEFQEDFALIENQDGKLLIILSED